MVCCGNNSRWMRNTQYNEVIFPCVYCLHTLSASPGFGAVGAHSGPTKLGPGYQPCAPSLLVFGVYVKQLPMHLLGPDLSVTYCVNSFSPCCRTILGTWLHSVEVDPREFLSLPPPHCLCRHLSTVPLPSRSFSCS